ncbi:MAG: peptidylprolyl isomerase [Planctomycetota bacterium]|jgi:parvulin-like peptidyl-prolyl isomerase
MATLFINGEKIEDALVEAEVEHLRAHHDRVFSHLSPQDREAQLLEWSRENVVEKVLLSQHAGEHGEQITSAEVEAAFNRLKEHFGSSEQLEKEFGTSNESRIKDRIELDMKVERMLEQVGSNLTAPSEDTVLKFYEENKKQFECPERIRVAHIVKHIDGRTDETTACNIMAEVRDKLRDGAVFELLAAKYSDCPDNGGDLGYITRGQMVEEFEDMVFNLGVNQTSDVFRTRFGYHIAKIYDRKPPFVPPLGEIRDRVVGELKEQMRNNAVDDFLDQLKNGADIKYE